MHVVVAADLVIRLPEVCIIMYIHRGSVGVTRLVLQVHAVAEHQIFPQLTAKTS